MSERFAGYEVTGPRTVLSAHCFVQRSTLPGKPWLLFLEKIMTPGEYWVTAHKTKGEAMR